MNIIVWVLSAWSWLLCPLFELVCDNHPYEKFKFSFHLLLPHILLLWDIFKALDFTCVNIDGSNKLLDPVTLDVLFE